METQKTCERCKFYESFYVIRGGKLKVRGGYCNNDAVHPYISNIMYNPKPCDGWLPAPTRKEAYIDNIKKLLNDINKNLKNIALILKDDEI